MEPEKVSYTDLKIIINLECNVCCLSWYLFPLLESLLISPLLKVFPKVLGLEKSHRENYFAHSTFFLDLIIFCFSKITSFLKTYRLTIRIILTDSKSVRFIRIINLYESFKQIRNP